VVVDGKLKRKAVQTGISSLTRTEIKEGLQPGANVAVAATNSQNLTDGASAKIVEQ